MATWVGALGEPPGRLLVLEGLTVPGHLEVFAVGDTMRVADPDRASRHSARRQAGWTPCRSDGSGCAALAWRIWGIAHMYLLIGHAVPAQLRDQPAVDRHAKQPGRLPFAAHSSSGGRVGQRLSLYRVGGELSASAGFTSGILLHDQGDPSPTTDVHEGFARVGADAAGQSPQSSAATEYLPASSV